jgi:uncharacterized membrane protein (UPF0127 family)
MVTNYKLCKSALSKAVGLMFSRKRNLLFEFDKEQRIPLHNFFVFFPINLVFMDKNKRIIEIKKNFKPFTFYTSKEKAKYLLETPFEIDYKTGDKFI